MIWRNIFSETIFNNKYKHENCETWEKLARTLVTDVCGELLPKGTQDAIVETITTMKFIPAGRYLYYAGRPNKFWNNCYLLRSEEDSREDWANLSWKVENCLMTGGGVGNDYSRYRCRGAPIKRTGGFSSGPLSKIEMVNEQGRRVMQGGGRRSALYASLNWQHPDINSFMNAKNWDEMIIAGTDGKSIGDLKRVDFNFHAPLDMTNISINYDDNWIKTIPYAGKLGKNDVFLHNVKQALSTGEPGFSFNFGEKENETLRNACTEVVSSDDSDVCNLGSINFSRISGISDLHNTVELATWFLLCGSLGADVPYDKVQSVREKNRRLGLGIIGLHEWLIKHNYNYQMVEELKEWLGIYERVSRATATNAANWFSCSNPVAVRAIAPTGTIGILAGTTTGIEPVFAVAYQRKYLTGKKHWKYQYVVDSAAQYMIDEYGTHPDNIESSISLARDWEQRIKFQYEVQKYVDQAISSTINLPKWGSIYNNEDHINKFAEVLSRYAHGLRGLTVYPDGARGGQPLTPVNYEDAKAKTGQEYEIVAHDVCDLTNKRGTCGV